MIRLLYISHAATGLTAEEQRKILKTARGFNPLVGITGVLIHGGGLFLQVLEGPEQSVLRLYVKILDDTRHTDCRIINISPVSERLFPTWTMGLIERDPLEFQEIARLSEQRLEVVDAQVFSDVLSRFVQVLRVGSTPSADA